MEIDRTINIGLSNSTHTNLIYSYSKFGNIQGGE